MKKNIYKHVVSFLIIIFVFSFALITKSALAENIVLVPDGGKKATGSYELNDVVQLGLNASQWILGIVGSLALLFFIYGGFTFLISAGNSAKVDEGKKIIVGAVIGLVLVFSSYLIIQFAMKAMGLEWSGAVVAPTVSPAAK